MLKLEHFGFTLRLLIFSILFISGIAKQLDPVEFTLSLKNQFGLSDLPSAIIASTLPALEIILAIGLLTRNFATFCLSIIRMLSVLFILVHLYTFVSENTFSACNCFGDLLPASPKYTFVMSLILGFTCFFPATKHGIDRDNYGVLQLFSRKRVKFSFSFLILLIISFIFRIYALTEELKVGLIHLADSNVKAKVTLIDSMLPFQLDRNDTTQSPNSTLFLFLRSPGCDICQTELRFWNTSPANKKLKLVAIFPQLSSDDTKISLMERFEKLAVWEHNIYLINNDQFREILGYKHCIGRVLVSESNRILLSQGDMGSDIERYEFVKKVQNTVSLF